MFKKSSSQEPLSQFEPKLTGNMLGDLDLFKYRRWHFFGAH